MTLVAHDYLHRLTRGQVRARFWLLAGFFDRLDPERRESAHPADRSGGDRRVHGDRGVKHYFQRHGQKTGKGQSDLELLAEIAATYDADFWVDGNVLYVSRFLKEYTPRLTLTWGESLLEFSPQVSTIGQVVGRRHEIYLARNSAGFLGHGLLGF